MRIESTRPYCTGGAAYYCRGESEWTDERKGKRGWSLCIVLHASSSQSRGGAFQDTAFSYQQLFVPFSVPFSVHWGNYGRGKSEGEKKTRDHTCQVWRGHAEDAGRSSFVLCCCCCCGEHKKTCDHGQRLIETNPPPGCTTRKKNCSTLHVTRDEQQVDVYGRGVLTLKRARSEVSLTRRNWKTEVDRGRQR